MAVHEWLSAFTNATVTDFRAWAQGVHDAVLACGWTVAADTGQVDIATMTIPAVNLTEAGYRVYDSPVAGGGRIVLRLGFGRGNAASTPMISMAVGVATDGAGVVTGQSVSTAMSNSVTTTASACYASGGDNHLHIVFRPSGGVATGTSGAWVVHIERAPDDSGIAAALAVAVAASGFTRTQAMVAQRGGSSLTTDTSWPVGPPASINGVPYTDPTASLSGDGVSAPVMPIPLACPGVTPWASRTMALVMPGDVGPGYLPGVDLGAGPVTLRGYANSSHGGTIKAANPFGLIPAILWTA